ncbi:hypothetical protein HDV00_001900 [Rhizophlyctis rosea]|nr:hypothetical protein HDV00_001900 [Rhizophlyctis rosea]
MTLVLEHFNQTQQPLLDDFLLGKITADDLCTKYEESGEEGFNIRTHYGYLLQTAKSLNVRILAGFLPRSAARKALSPEGPDAAIEHAANMGWIDPDIQNHMHGSPAHFQYFKSAITGTPYTPPTTTFTTSSDSEADRSLRRIFPSQILRDASLSHIICQTLREAPTSDCKVLAICGAGHAEFGFGAPERVVQAGFEKPLVITCRSQRELLGDEYVKPFVRAVDEGREGLMGKEDTDGLGEEEEEDQGRDGLLGGDTDEVDSDSDDEDGEGPASARPRSGSKVWALSDDQTQKLQSAVGDLHADLADFVFVYDAVDEDDSDHEPHGEDSDSEGTDGGRHPGVEHLDRDVGGLTAAVDGVDLDLDDLGVVDSETDHTYELLHDDLTSEDNIS